MNSSIRIVKRRRDENPNDLKTPDLKTPDAEESVERSTREMVSTVKSWIAELQQRKRAQRLSFSDPPVIATAGASQNT